jgi:hypothetical protein
MYFLLIFNLISCYNYFTVKSIKHDENEKKKKSGQEQGKTVAHTPNSAPRLAFNGRQRRYNSGPHVWYAGPCQTRLASI